MFKSLDQILENHWKNTPKSLENKSLVFPIRTGKNHWTKPWIFQVHMVSRSGNETPKNHGPEKWSETLSFDMSAWVDVNCMTWIRWNFRRWENTGFHTVFTTQMFEMFSQFLLNQCFCFAELVYAHLVPGGPKPEPPTRTLDRTSGPWTWASDAARRNWNQNGKKPW